MSLNPRHTLLGQSSWFSISIFSLSTRLWYGLFPLTSNAKNLAGTPCEEVRDWLRGKTKLRLQQRCRKRESSRWRAEVCCTLYVYGDYQQSFVLVWFFGWAVITYLCEINRRLDFLLTENDVKEDQLSLSNCIYKISRKMNKIESLISSWSASLKMRKIWNYSILIWKSEDL